MTIALAHGLALSIAVFVTGHISGGHVNPAVTLGRLVTKRIKPPDAVGDIIGHLAGATIAALVLRKLSPRALDDSVKTGGDTWKARRQRPRHPGPRHPGRVGVFLITTTFSAALTSRDRRTSTGSLSA